MVTLDWLHLTLLFLLISVSLWHVISMAGAQVNIIQKGNDIKLLRALLQGQEMVNRKEAQASERTDQQVA